MPQETIEEVTLCKKCKNEVRECNNDLDSFHICDFCNEDNFTGNLKTDTYKKITSIITKIKYKKI